ncbi:glycosyl transferase [Polaromonas sp.]|uniref:ArnT family glycosyltransferase n=1 Tax=Polaromonas sp. TaxID=1869339 RepID=UPI00286BEDE0|nr:glycosyl transferase [Polaromonas sp.]
MTSPEKSTTFPVHYRWLALGIVVALGYLFGLGGDHIPRGGDELVYAHIARLTAATGHWLPLVSSYDFMRNTKPPLLFWQAMVAGGWGEHWSWFNLRLPGVLYTWATALMVGLLTWKIVGGNEGQAASINPTPSTDGLRRHAVTMGAIAALVYLSFFTTYRYGRSYMTSGPETFWLFGIFFALAWSPARLLASRWKLPLLAGVAVGIACLYKSFAMVAPLGFALALCYQTVGARQPPWKIFRPGIVVDGLKVAAACALALAIFGLWFALDPQPGEVWREFVVGENAGKFKSSPGYFKVAFSGGSGFLTILTGYFSNALFLLPITVGCAWAAWRSYRQKVPLSDAEKILWLWLFGLALVFMLPNQRSTRYLIPAMPALAVLVALYWQRIARFWFALTLLACALGALAMGLIAYGALRAVHDTGLYSWAYWLFLAGLLAACVGGLIKREWTRPVAAVAGFAVLFALAWVTAPFNGELARFKAASVARLQGQTVAVPSSFNGHFERYEFIIPGARVMPYFAEQPVDYTEVDALLQAHRYALVQRRIGQLPCTQCRIIDMRWDLRARKGDRDGMMAAFTSPDTYFYAQEYLVEGLAP